MKRPLQPSRVWRPQYPTLKALLLCGSLAAGGSASADVTVPDKGKPGAVVPTPKGRVSRPLPLPPGLPPQPQPVQPKKDDK